MTLYVRFGKRLLDLAIAGVAAVVLSPLMALAALAIVLEDGRPVFFKQERVGRRHDKFNVIKFRTMRAGAANVPSRAADDLLVTRVGAALRRTNLDELPQLLSIARGDMSVVGPRPAVPSQRALIALRSQGGVYTLRPGLTGLAQIRAYDGMADEEKAAHDIEYASRVTFTRDLFIVLGTLRYLSKPPPKY